MIKATWRGRFIWLTRYRLSTGEAKSGTWVRNLDSGTDAETTQECWLLATLCGLLSLLNYTTQGLLPRGGTILSEQGPLRSIIIQENAPQNCKMGSLKETIPELTFPLSSWQNMNQHKNTSMNYVTSAVEPKTKHKVHSCFVYINFACMYICAHVCVSCVCVGVHVCGECIWRPEDNLGCHP